MKFYFIFFLTVMMVLGCSQNISESLKNPLVITSEREIISDLESLENNLYQSLNNSSAKNMSLEDIGFIVNISSIISIKVRLF